MRAGKEERKKAIRIPKRGGKGKARTYLSIRQAKKDSLRAGVQ